VETTERRWFVLGAAALVLLALVVGLVGGALLGDRIVSRSNSSVDVPEGAVDEFELMAEAWRTIEEEYVNQDGVVPQQMAYRAIDGMVETLGDAGHTRFMPPEVAERHQNQLEGEFEGIGAYVEMRDGRAVIVAPIDDSPAERAGLEAGDVIVGVDGEDVTGLSLTDIVGRVLGPAGTEVTLTIRDADAGETREITLERAVIDLDLVSWQRLPGSDVAYVRISAFSDGATEELEETLGEVREEEGIEGLVLDLRNNPGGLLNEAVGVSSQFVESGMVLRRRDAEGEVREVSVRDGIEAVDLPMVVLINSGTASAAEIVTGALQDNDRATVVGTTTFGAGTVLNQFPLSGGAVLLLAVEEWLTPDGRVIWKEGLAPDERVTLPPDAEPLPRLRLEDITEEELENSGDRQLQRALELLE